MADHSTLRPDPSIPGSLTKPSGAGLPRELLSQPEVPGLEADFADLAAKFAAHGGAGLSPELSADLALEIVLNEIVSQACLTTGATAAAVAFRREGELICRASCGNSAPVLGSRLDTASGLTGVCIETKLVQRCDDAQADLRVDIEACWQMGVRSVMVLPLLRDGEVLGVFELFSSRSSAFSERDELTVGALVRRVLWDLERADIPLSPDQADPVLNSGLFQIDETFPSNADSRPSDHPPSHQPVEALPNKPERETVPRRGIIAFAWVGMIVVACAILMGLIVALRLGSRRTTARIRPVRSVSEPLDTPSAAAARLRPGMGTPSPAAAPPGKASASRSDSSLLPAPSLHPGVPAPEGSLLVYENGKEVFRVTPSSEPPPAAGATGIEQASSLEQERVFQLPPPAAEDGVLYRVEPDYPEEARQKQIQGTVVLEVRIGRDGAVQDMQLMSGQPLLAQAAMDAVKQWRFKQRAVNGRTVEMQTTITLNFRLPAGPS
jgi:TonB family protein